MRRGRFTNQARVYGLLAAALATDRGGAFFASGARPGTGGDLGARVDTHSRRASHGADAGRVATQNR